MREFERYIGIDYSGAATQTTSPGVQPATGKPRAARRALS